MNVTQINRIIVLNLIEMINNDILMNFLQNEFN